MENIKTLKQDNNKALAYLHNCFFFDFQKPFVIIKQDGKFTANSIKSCLSNEIADFSPDDYEIVLLIRPYDYGDKIDKQHAVNLDGKFDVDAPRGYSYDIDRFYNKADFEEDRKKRIAYYFIVAQKKEYLCEPILNRNDTTARYKYIPGSYEMYNDGKGNSYYRRVHIKGLHKNEQPFEWVVQYKYLQTLSEVIDKSGYLTCEFRSELNRRVCAYKNKKRKAEFLATDYSGVVKVLDGLFDKLKTDIAKAVINITNSSQSRLLERALDKFTWGLSHFNKYRQHIAEKYYDSKECAENAEKNIRGYIDEAFEVIREAANEADGK